MASAINKIGPGEDLEFGEKAEVWYEKNSRVITVILAILVVAVIGYRIYNSMRQGRIEQASTEFAPVVENISTAMSETDDAKRRDKLKGAISESERVSSVYAGMNAGRTAQLALGNAHYYLAAGLLGAEAETELKAARAAYEKYLAEAKAADEKAAGQLALGNTLENLWYFKAQDTSLGLDATKAYQSVETLLPGSYLAGEAKLAQARLLQAQTGRQDAAKKLYTELAADRRVDLSEYAKEKPIKQDKGREITPEEIAKLKTSEPESYEYVAQKSIARLNATAAGK